MRCPSMGTAAAAAATLRRAAVRSCLEFPAELICWHAHRSYVRTYAR